MADDPPLVKEIYIEASPEQVFPFLVEPARMARWLGLGLEIDPRPGGTFRVDPNGREIMRGEFLEVVPPGKVVFTFGWEAAGAGIPPGSTIVEIELTPRGDGTLVRLTHRKLPGAVRSKHELGWVYHLGRLKVVSEGGDPGPGSCPTPETWHGDTR